VKLLKGDQLLLTKNEIYVDGNKLAENTPEYTLPTQKPNITIPILKIPVGLHLHNLAEKNPDSTFQAWLKRKPKREQRWYRLISKKQVDGLKKSKTNFNNWLKRTGDAPVIINTEKSKKSILELKRYYYTKGYLNVNGSYTILKDSTRKNRGSVKYKIKLGNPYFIDSIRQKINSPAIDSLFQITKSNSFIKKGKQYNAQDFSNERDRLTIQFRNSGLYHFNSEYITFDADTNNTKHNVHINYIIPDRKISQGDSVVTEPFKVHTVNQVLVVTDYSFKNKDKKITDSTEYKGYKLYGFEKIKYRPKSITDAISILPKDIFKDIDRTLTYNQLGALQNFKYPNISYTPDPKDSSGTGLIATILLSPFKKYNFEVDFDTYTSTIQQFGIGFSTNLLFRNIFRGAENLEISTSGSVGSSAEIADTDSRFFNTSEIGINARLSIPRILFPITTEKFIPKYTAPITNIGIGINAQNNIGLDRQNFNGTFSYQWKPKTVKTYEFELANIQYVRHLNTRNFFNVFRSSFNRLNEIATEIDYSFLNPNENTLGIPNEVDLFINQVLNTNNNLNIPNELINEVRSIKERQQRLTEDNLIFSSSFNWTRDTRSGIYDNTFSRFRWKIESSGNLLSAIAPLTNLETNEEGNSKLFGVTFSQYIKLESDFIRHWQLSNNAILAIRSFSGIAIPYGNSNNIPFTQSYFAGGANDNRGWRAYDLGPGSSGGILDFNEANLKIAFNAEYRFTIVGGFKGALFIDVGNIWNALDEVEDPVFRFDGLEDLDNFKNSVINIGINYPF